MPSMDSPAVTQIDAMPLASPAFTGDPTAPTPAAGDSDTSIATTAWAAERAKVGNLLTVNEASVETGTTGFTASDATIARATGGLVGTYCLEVTCTAANGGAFLYGNASGGTMPIVAGVNHTFRVMAKAASITRTVYVKVFWWQSNGTSAASTASHTSPGTVLSTAWKLVDITAQAPANAAFASLQIYAASSANAEVYLVDTLSFHLGAGGDWSPPGVPVVNLGKRVTRPNVDDIHVQTWSGVSGDPSAVGRWQTVHYDSGMRSLDATAFAVDTGKLTLTLCQLRRLGSTVWLSFYGTKVGTGAGVVATLPAGFRSVGSDDYQQLIDFTTKAFGGISSAQGSSGNVYWDMGSPTAGRVYTCTLRFHTTDAIPTSLPGALASAAPA